jgi:hypothetical protein
VSLAPRPRLASSLRLAAVAFAAIVSLAACSGGSPLTALKPYAASDGLQVTAGDVRGLNLILLTRGVGEPAALTGTLDNTGTSDATATLGIAGTSVTVEVPAGSSVRLGLADGDTPIVVAAAHPAPGLIATVDLTVGGASAAALVPVLDGTLPEYSAVLDALDSYLAAHVGATAAASPAP